jgi:hypothetical protein
MEVVLFNVGHPVLCHTSNVRNENASTQGCIAIKHNKYSNMFRLDMLSHLQAVSTNYTRQNHVKLCIILIYKALRY